MGLRPQRGILYSNQSTQIDSLLKKGRGLGFIVEGGGGISKKKRVRKGAGLRVQRGTPLFHQSAWYHMAVRWKVCEEKGGA